MSDVNDILEALLNKQAEEKQNEQLEKFASDVYDEGFLAGFSACLEKVAEDLVTPGDSPAGNQVAMTIQKALELSTGGDPQVLDTDATGKDGDAEDGAEKTAAEEMIALLSKLAEGEDDPTPEEVEHEADVAEAVNTAKADLDKQAIKAAIKQQLQSAAQ